MDVAAVAEAGGLPVPDVAFAGADPILPTAFRCGEAAALAIGLVARTAVDAAGLGGEVAVDVARAAHSLVSFAFVRVDGAPARRLNDGNPTVAMYPTADGRHLHLHGGFPGLRATTLEVLGCAPDADADVIGAAVLARESWALEDELAAAGTCGAVARTPQEWDAHPQGLAVAPLPVVRITRIGDGPVRQLPVEGDRPLGGVRVVDLTRVLAGPTCGRTLAEHGADVMRISGPGRPSMESFVIDTGHGKRAAEIDLDTTVGVESLHGLIAGADVVSQGYRRATMRRRGFGPETLAERHPGLVVTSINCYGPEGPWRDRPGWEQLAQTATGVLVENGTLDAPVPLPAAATDYTTGFLAAYGAVEALRRRSVEGGSWHVEVSLCQTALWLRRLARVDPAVAAGLDDVGPWSETTPTVWGDIEHLAPVAQVSAAPARWARPVVPLGSNEPTW